MQYFRSEQEYKEYTYRRELKRTANGLGALLLIFFGLEIAVVIILEVFLWASGKSDLAESSEAFDMIESGLISMLLFFVAAAVYCLIRRLSFAKLFPFQKTGAKRLFMICFIGITLSLMSNYAADLVTQVFSLIGIRNDIDMTADGSSVPAILLSYLTIAVMPACVEEFAFRGVIMGSLRKYSDALALIVSSAMFAMMHGNFVQIPFTFCGGLVFGYIAIKSNSLLPGIIVHFLNNAISVTIDILSSYHVMSDNMLNVLFASLIVILAPVSIVFIKKLIDEDPGFFRFTDSDGPISFNRKMGTVASSPTLISFTALMMLFAVWLLLR